MNPQIVMWPRHVRDALNPACKKDKANTQFVAASKLFLMPTEGSELAGMRS
jgi:hypothetical protein